MSGRYQQQPQYRGQRERIGANGPEYQRIGNGSQMNGKYGAGRMVFYAIIAAIATAALVMSIITLARQGDSTIEGSTIENLSVLGILDLSEVEGIMPPPWHEEIGGPTRRVVNHQHGRMHTIYNLVDERTDILVGGAPVRVNIDISLSKFHNKDIHLYSRSADAHEVVITNPDGYWDKEARFKKAVFDEKEGCFLVFRPVDKYSVMIVQAQGVRLCNDDLTFCRGSITSLYVENLKADNLTATTLTATTLSVLNNLNVAGNIAADSLDVAGLITANRVESFTGLINFLGGDGLFFGFGEIYGPLSLFGGILNGDIVATGFFETPKSTLYQALVERGDEYTREYADFLDTLRQNGAGIDDLLRTEGGDSFLYELGGQFGFRVAYVIDDHSARDYHARLAEEMFHVKFEREDRLAPALRNEILRKQGDYQSITEAFNYHIGAPVDFFGATGGGPGSSISTLTTRQIHMFNMFGFARELARTNGYIDFINTYFATSPFPDAGCKYARDACVTPFLNLRYGNSIKGVLRRIYGNIMYGPEELEDGEQNLNYFMTIDSVKGREAKKQRQEPQLTKTGVIWRKYTDPRYTKTSEVFSNGWFPLTRFNYRRDSMIKQEGVEISREVNIVHPTYLRAKYPLRTAPSYANTVDIDVTVGVGELRGFNEDPDQTDDHPFSAQLWQDGVVVQESGARGGNDELQFYSRENVRIEQADVQGTTKDVIVVKVNYTTNQYIPSATRNYADRLHSPRGNIPGFADGYGQWNGVAPAAFQFKYTSGRVQGKHSFKHGRLSCKIRFSSQAAQFGAFWLLGVDNSGISVPALYWTNKIEPSVLSTAGLTFTAYDFVDNNQWLGYGLKNYLLTETSSNTSFSLVVVDPAKPMIKYGGYDTVFFGAPGSVTYRFGQTGGLVEPSTLVHSGSEPSGDYPATYIYENDGTPTSGDAILTHAYYFSDVLATDWPISGEIDLIESFFGHGYGDNEYPDALFIGSTQVYNADIPWYNFGNNGNGGVRLHFSRDFQVDVENSEPERAATVSTGMTKWYDVAVYRDTNTIEVTIDGRTVIKRVRTDYTTTDNLDKLFDNEMVWITTLALGGFQYNINDEFPGTEAAIQQDMKDGKYRIEVSDIKIESDDPIVTVAQTFIARVAAARRRRKRAVVIAEHRAVDPAIYASEKLTAMLKVHSETPGMQETGGTAPVPVGAPVADAIKHAYGMDAPTPAPTAAPGASPAQMTAAQEAAAAAAAAAAPTAAP